MRSRKRIAQVGRLLQALGRRACRRWSSSPADHGEAFGEHGEISHSIFVYDTTLRVPLIVAGPGRRDGRRPRRCGARRPCADGAARNSASPRFDSDGIDSRRAAARARAADARALRRDRSRRCSTSAGARCARCDAGGWKYIAAPKPELFDLATDPCRDTEPRRVGCAARCGAERARRSDLAADADDKGRGGSRGRGAAAGARLRRRRCDGVPRRRARSEGSARARGAHRAGDVGRARRVPRSRQALEQILKDDPSQPAGAPAARLPAARREQCADARTALPRARSPAICPVRTRYLGLAACQAAARRFAGAERDAERRPEAAEPDNPVVVANLGILLSDSGHPAEAVPLLERALALDPTSTRRASTSRSPTAAAGQRAARRRDAPTSCCERLPPDAPAAARGRAAPRHGTVRAVCAADPAESTI